MRSPKPRRILSDKGTEQMMSTNHSLESPAAISEKDQSPFDPDRAMELVDGDEDLFRELTDVFAAECPRQLLAVRDAIADNDSDALARIHQAHVGRLAKLLPIARRSLPNLLFQRDLRIVIKPQQAPVHLQPLSTYSRPRAALSPAGEVSSAPSTDRRPGRD